MNILLIGYYGKRNIGDDLFVRQLTHHLAQQDHVESIFVFCQEAYYPPISSKVHYLPSETLSKFKKIEILLKTDCIAWGGGTLNISGKPTSLLRLQTLAKALRKQFCFLGIGLEGTESGSPAVARLFERSSLLYLRDRHSYDFATQRLPGAHQLCLGGDLAFLDLSLYENFVKSSAVKVDRLKHLAFCGKFWWGEGRAEFYANYLNTLIEAHQTMIHLLPGHMGTERNDNKFHQLLQKYLPASHCQIHEWQQPEEFLTILSQMDCCISNRLHSLIAADLLGVPNLGIGNHHSKIGHYVMKSGMVPDLRIADLMEPLPIDRLEALVNQYQRPAAFITSESKTAQINLHKLFTYNPSRGTPKNRASSAP
jgi:polysaccharide pyruvyl transferase WcaK-like protein